MVFIGEREGSRAHLSLASQKGHSLRGNVTELPQIREDCSMLQPLSDQFFWLCAWESMDQVKHLFGNKAPQS